MTTLYRGYTEDDGKKIVWADGKPLEPYYAVRRHSQHGLNWGYPGTGPRQLSLAILCDLVGPDLAQDHDGEFCNKIIARIDKPNWTMTADFVLGWLSSRIGYDAVMRAVAWCESEGGAS